ncbi:hypothetical protein [Tenacibaculum jejuense]|uniref:Uncharacterized protein n=1 Tax=Tenacibaculum jejuense TaxID=584609 RepID=A0A238U5P4_9FLAO|nr:hypothetical protein [Tenacibaculum jejuense]SNR14523.1 exported protein of unknown function [Tenacibaculum jejuense]
MKTLKMSIVMFLSLTSLLVSAQNLGDKKERFDNKYAVVTGKQQLKKDIHQLEVFKKKIIAFEEAFIGHETKRVNLLKADILSDMKREIKQSERKINQNRVELKQSKIELRNSKRELKRTKRNALRRNTVQNRKELRDEKRDTKDDRRDLRDDKRDLETQIARTNRQKEIYKKIKAFNFSNIKASGKRKLMTNSKLLNDFAKTMEADITATKIELKEDFKEMNEDRIERRENLRS